MTVNIICCAKSYAKRSLYRPGHLRAGRRAVGRAASEADEELEVLRDKKSSGGKAFVGGEETVIFRVENGEAIELEAELEHDRDAIFGIRLRYACGACDVRFESQAGEIPAARRGFTARCPAPGFGHGGHRGGLAAFLRSL